MINFNIIDRAKRYHKSSIFNLQFRLVRVRLGVVKSYSEIFIEITSCLHMIYAIARLNI